MVRSNREYKLEVVDAGEYRSPTLEAVQQALLEPLAEQLAAVIKERLATGELVAEDANVAPTGREDGDSLAH